MKYTHLFATDMDYTLLLPGKDISEENIKAIKALDEAGVAFTLSTGRSSFLTTKYARALGLKFPIITSNGGALYDYSQHKDIYSNDFSEECLRAQLKLIIDNKLDATGYSSSGLYLSEGTSRSDFLNNYNATEPDYDKIPLYKLTSDILDSEQLPTFNKFLLISPPADVLAQFKAMPELEIVSSAKDFEDVMCAGATKGNALMVLADHLGIPRANTFAIGDADNDLSALEAAGHAIAMGNSTSAVLEAADYVTDICEKDGFAKAIYDYVLPLVKGLR